MNQNSFKNDVEKMGNWWHKLIFLCNRNTQFNSSISFIKDFERININLILSEGLITVAKNSYPLYVESIILDAIKDDSKVHILEHIDILFDPVLQIHPIRLLENISKKNKLIVEWPGKYEDGRLIYAEPGLPEYLVCHEFEGRVIMK